MGPSAAPPLTSKGRVPASRAEDHSDDASFDVPGPAAHPPSSSSSPSAQAAAGVKREGEANPAVSSAVSSASPRSQVQELNSTTASLGDELDEFDRKRARTQAAALAARALAREAAKAEQDNSAQSEQSSELSMSPPPPLKKQGFMNASDGGLASMWNSKPRPKSSSRNNNSNDNNDNNGGGGGNRSNRNTEIKTLRIGNSEQRDVPKESSSKPSKSAGNAPSSSQAPKLKY